MTDYITHLGSVTESDAQVLRKAQANYGDSWKRRGGIGAFMMLARKWDRLENAMTGGEGDAYDIFTRIEADERPEGIMDDVRDLRRYLVLIEAEMIARGHQVPEQYK